jgi:RNA polymerase sigma-70 factor (ECF subfamily)
MSDPQLDLSFRRESAKLVAALVRRLGSEHLGVAEDAVQEAFVAAAQLWPKRGIPPNPSAWLSLVSLNKALDALRRQRSEILTVQEGAFVEPLEQGREDDELLMLFLCCHPALSMESQILLILRELCGLSTAECARSLLLSEDAAAQRLVRAKAALKSAHAPFEVGLDEMRSRLPMVLRALHLLFTEGYACAAGPDVTCSETCDEAILLSDRLSSSEIGNAPATHALVALMLLQSSRLPARISDDGMICLLEEQDRSKWDRDRIDEGIRRLARAGCGAEVSRYHLEAGIAAVHATAPDFASTDWPAILDLYDQLADLDASPITLLNRAVALAYARDPLEGLRQLDAISAEKSMNGYFWLAATRARLLEMSGLTHEASRAYQLASQLTASSSYQNFLSSRCKALAESIFGE